MKNLLTIFAVFLNAGKYENTKPISTTCITTIEKKIATKKPLRQHEVKIIDQITAKVKHGLGTLSLKESKFLAKLPPNKKIPPLKANKSYRCFLSFYGSGITYNLPTYNPKTKQIEYMPDELEEC